MSDFINTVWKVGNQEMPVGREHWGYKDGMFVSWKDADKQLSDHMKKTFAIIKFPKSYLTRILSFQEQAMVLNPEIKIVLDSSFRRSPLHINISEIAGALKIKGLEDDWRAEGKVVEPIDGTSLTQDVMQDSTLKIFSDNIIDLNAITSGTCTVGEGGTYDTWGDFTADVGTQTGNLTCQVIEEFVLSNQTFTHDISSYDFKITQTTKFSYIINVATNGYNFTNVGSGNCIVDNHFFKANASTMESCVQQTASATGSWKLKVYNCKMDGNGYTYTSGGRAVRLNPSTLESLTSELHNLVIWDMYRGIECTDGNNDSCDIQNCVIYNSISNCIRGWGRIKGQINCLYHVQAGGQCVTSTSSNPTYCSANDSSLGAGTGNVDYNAAGKSITDYVLSTDDTSGNFLKIKDYTDAKEGGTNSGLFSENTAGIDGNARPHDTNKVSKSAYEWGGDITPPSLAISSIAK